MVLAIVSTTTANKSRWSPGSIIAHYWKQPDKLSPNSNAKGPPLHLIKLNDPMPRELSDLMLPFLYSGTNACVVARPQVAQVPAQVPLQVPWQPQQPGGAANNSWLD